MDYSPTLAQQARPLFPASRSSCQSRLHNSASGPSFSTGQHVLHPRRQRRQAFRQVFPKMLSIIRVMKRRVQAANRKLVFIHQTKRLPTQIRIDGNAHRRSIAQ